MKKHDMVGKGFNVDPHQLAHDLAILKLSKHPNIRYESDEREIYELYTELLNEFLFVINDKTRYDSAIKSDEPAL